MTEPQATDITGAAQTQNRQIPLVEGQQPQGEAAPEALSPKFAALAKKEKELRSRVQALKAEQDAIKAEKEAFKAKQAEYESSYVPKAKLKDLITQDPGSLGLTQEELLNLALNGPKPENALEQKLMAKIQELEEKQAKSASDIESQQTKAYERAVNQVRTETKALVESDERFETIKATNSVDSVVELIKKTFDEEEILLSVEDAAQQVEDYLVEQALNLAQLKKIKEKLAPKPAEQPQAPPKQPQTMNTLTHAVNATTKPLTADGRRERAILAFQGKL